MLLTIIVNIFVDLRNMEFENIAIKQILYLINIMLY